MKAEEITRKKYTNYGQKHNKQKAKDPRFDWRTIFLKNSGGFSSKRILAIMGFVLSCVIFTVAFITEKDVPEFGETLLICCVSLYGVDVVPNFWSKTINKS